ncbi:protein containing YcaO-like domain [Sulfurimonas gotlandica GD1]|uniref:Protein containing YcaO-like domain n=1 Tax=Sulfurimonas gotlandica (strain DSM 19862 / JCM 16533 / GD1) TaxID=929558 RepID=B6BNY5_SULGG|nr:YcaO-like family protein [Sulfurimonas gotlandica]EDZ61246.1 YcaO [Sulfurimonas gotlandica GD1]EHP28941.1 protein containing YcaO-like domain [Sulfurimonas gotlandica GD1]
MNLLSKNAPLEESIAKMQAVLADAGCEMTFSQQKHPLENCYSVNLTSVEAPRHIYSNGKGIVSDASVASALGEYIERLQTNNFFIDFHLPSRKYYPDEVAFEFGGDYLNDELREVYNPSKELSDDDLVDFNSDYEDKIVALPFIKHSTSEKIYIPLNILSNLYVSNGLATGNTPLEAQVQSLSEIFERYAKIEIIKNGYALPNFPDELVESFPRVHKDVLALRELGYIVEVLDASLGGKFPVTAISLINPNNSTLFVSFGAHPILEVSLERTMTELMQGRSLENLDSFEVPTFDMSLVADSFNLESHFVDSNGKLGFGFLSSRKSFEYSPFLYDGTTSEQEYDYLMEILKDMGKESYLREYNYLGFYSCQMIVPGISEVYPIDDLIYNNKNNGKLIRDMVLNFKDYDPQDILMSIEQLEDTLNMEKYIGVIFENNFNMLDFKAQIHLLLGETEDALEILEYGTNKLGHIIVEIARMEEMELEFSEYEDALYNIFTEEKVLKALKILDGDDFLIDTTLHADYQNMLAMYDRLENKK